MDDILLRRLFKASAEYYLLVETGTCADRGNGTKHTPQEITDELISALVDVRISRPDVDETKGIRIPAGDKNPGGAFVKGFS